MARGMHHGHGMHGGGHGGAVGVLALYAIFGRSRLSRAIGYAAAIGAILLGLAVILNASR